MILLEEIYSIMERIDPQYRDYALLTESQVSKSISAAKKLVMDRLGYNNEEADEFVRVKLRGELPALRTDNGGKFILGVTRMFCDNQLTDGSTIMTLNRTLELVASDAHINEYDRNLNGMSAQELIERFAGARQEMGDKDREDNAALELQENNDYTIIKIDNFEQSSQYGQYTDWCVTYDSDMLEQYTSGGVGQFYFCLKNGFENVPQQKGEGCPLDEYGLSMVAVSVDGDGNLNTCTCRWNHANGGHDHIMNTKQISQLIGRNFYEVFKPNNKWKETISAIKQKLASGLKYNEIEELCLDTFFKPSRGDNYVIVYVTGTRKYNYVRVDTKPQKLISEKWFDYCSRFENVTINGKTFTFAVVENGYVQNLIRPDGTLVSEQWFRKVFNFKEDGFAEVYNDEGKCNLMRIDGTLLSPDLWFDSLNGKFKNGWLKVDLDNKENLINLNGKLLIDKWYYYVTDLFNGYAVIKNDDAYSNYVNENGDIISPNLWFDFCGFFTKYGCAAVYKGNGINIIDGFGNLLLKNWINREQGGFFKFNFNGKELSLDTEDLLIGEKLIYEWYITNASTGYEYTTDVSKTSYNSFKEAYYDGLKRLNEFSTGSKLRLYITKDFGGRIVKTYVALRDSNGVINTYI